MNGYEKLINKMRAEGAKNNPPKIKIGVMTSATSVRLGDLELDKDDIVFLWCSLTGYTDSQGNCVPPLAAGDRVAMYRLSSEKYLCFGRLDNA